VGSSSRSRDAAHPERLLVLIPDSLSALVAKGEVTERYYNPGDLFSDVHIAMTNDDRPAPEDVQPMVGSARLHLHNLPPSPSMFVKSLGWRPSLLRRWAASAVRLAGEVQPQLIRCHGAHLNGFAASEVRRRLGIPYVVSLHGNSDRDLRRHWGPREGDWRFRVQLWAGIALERATISSADCVVCVYRFIEPFAKRMGARRVEVIYNVVNAANIRIKTDYALHQPPQLILPGRQMIRKDPRPVLQALAELPEVKLTLIGDGPLHDEAVDLAQRLGLSARCQFPRSMPNDRLCRSLADHDVLISVNDYGGVSKVELEAALTGMPVVTNAHPQEEHPEVLGDACLAVSGTPLSYAEAIRRLLADERLRAQLGQTVRANAEAVRPETMEERYVALYTELLQTPGQPHSDSSQATLTAR